MRTKDFYAKENWQQMGKSNRQKRRDELKKDLTDQLERNGTNGAYYDDLVDDYLRFWDMKCALHKDLKERGEKIEKYDSRGQKQIGNNESIEQSIKVNGQMLKILSELGIQPSQHGGDGDEL